MLPAAVVSVRVGYVCKVRWSSEGGFPAAVAEPLVAIGARREFTGGH